MHGRPLLEPITKSLIPEWYPLAWVGGHIGGHLCPLFATAPNSHLHILTSPMVMMSLPPHAAGHSAAPRKASAGMSHVVIPAPRAQAELEPFQSSVCFTLMSKVSEPLWCWLQDQTHSSETCPNSELLILLISQIWGPSSLTSWNKPSGHISLQGKCPIFCTIECIVSAVGSLVSQPVCASHGCVDHQGLT